MQALAFWKAVAMDRSNFLESLIALLNERQVRYCVIGGLSTKWRMSNGCFETISKSSSFLMALTCPCGNLNFGFRFKLIRSILRSRSARRFAKFLACVCASRP